MKEDTKRILLFLLACIPVRCIPIVVLFLTSKFNLPIAILYLLVGISFLYRTQSYNSNQKGFFGGKVWWQNLRYMHGALYLIAGFLLLFGQIELVKQILIIDLVIALVLFFNHYFL